MQWRVGLLVGAFFFTTVTPCIAEEVGVGREIFHDSCATCHGKDMANPGLAFDLRKFPKDDPERFRNSVLNGKGKGMPAWQSQLSPEDVKALWAYVNSGG